MAISYNPFQDPIGTIDDVFAEDAMIKSENDLTVAKKMAGVIGYDEHLLRIVKSSGDKNLQSYVVSNHQALEGMNLFMSDFQRNLKSDERAREFLVWLSHEEREAANKRLFRSYTDLILETRDNILKLIDNLKLLADSFEIDGLLKINLDKHFAYNRQYVKVMESMIAFLSQHMRSSQIKKKLYEQKII